MLNDLARDHHEVNELFAIASERLGFDLWALVSEGSASELNLTENTQPAMLVSGVACYRVWTKLSNIRPAWMAGHSLGEYTALVCAGALGFSDAVGLVRERGLLMQKAVPPGVGAMAAILGVDDLVVSEICAHLSKPGAVVSPANFNAPGQIVIAGHAEAVCEAMEQARLRGARRTVQLPVSVPSHCLLMEEISVGYGELLDKIHIMRPEIPVIHNVDADVHDEPELIRDTLKSQLFNSVRWADSVRYLANQGVDKFVECGPGKILAGLNRRIVPQSIVEAMFDSSSINKVLALVT
jgi:[acyl-carrier-protein] S-malonyltransferase